MSKINPPITIEEVERWCAGTISDHTTTRLRDILNGDYPLEEAVEDILSFRPKQEDSK